MNSTMTRPIGIDPEARLNLNNTSQEPNCSLKKNKIWSLSKPKKDPVSLRFIGRNHKDKLLKQRAILTAFNRNHRGKPTNLRIKLTEAASKNLMNSSMPVELPIGWAHGGRTLRGSFDQEKVKEQLDVELVV